MRILVCGQGNWTRRGIIRKELERFKPSLVIHGGAKGADNLAAVAAVSIGVHVIEFPANWERHGKYAGRIRNQQMLDEGKPDLVMAFFTDRTKSKGTNDMIGKARKAGIPTIIYEYPKEVKKNEFPS